jgi:hypothetical protein
VGRATACRGGKQSYRHRFHVVVVEQGPAYSLEFSLFNFLKIRDETRKKAFVSVFKLGLSFFLLYFTF